MKSLARCAFVRAALAWACAPSVPLRHARGGGPALSGRTLEGRTASLSDYKGKVVLVDFWATWCDPCKDEIPELVKLQNDLGSKGFVILGVSMDEETEAVAPFAKATKINYPVILNGGERSPTGWVVPGLPTAYLIGRDGNGATTPVRVEVAQEAHRRRRSRPGEVGLKTKPEGQALKFVQSPTCPRRGHARYAGHAAVSGNQSAPPPKHPFFRLGDFYEMFGLDAQEASQILGLVLTQRQGVPMCGVPYHNAQNYVARLLRAGRKVAIAEQLEAPSKDKEARRARRRARGDTRHDRRGRAS